MAGAAGEMNGEGNWKADAEYRHGVKDFSETHDAEKMAHGAAELDEDDDEANEPPPSKDENEW